MSRNKVNQTDGSLTMVAGRGKAEYGASTVRKGTFTNASALQPNSSGILIEKTFSTPMPDADYEMSFTFKDVVGYFVLQEKTASGFSGYLYRNGSTSCEANTMDVHYTAFKLYTDTEYNEVLERTDANELGTSVDLTSYTTLENCFVVPSDGYLWLSVATSGDKASARVYGATGSNFIALSCSSGNASLFVKKGMRIYTFITGSPSANYYPLS